MGKELTKTTSTLIAPQSGLEIEFVSDTYGDELLDTEVKIAGKVLCTIAGTQIPAFKRELITLVEKYRI
jgi:hypothetical protein